MEELIILRTIWVLFALMSLSWSEVRTLPSMVLLDSHSPNTYMNYPLVTLATLRMLFAMFPSTDYFSSGTRLSRNCLSFSGAYIFRRDSFLANISGHSFRNVSLEISPALYLFIPMFMLSEEEPSRDSAMPEILESESESSLHADFNLLSGTGIRLMECL